jgi:hypothetical protein
VPGRLLRQLQVALSLVHGNAFTVTHSGSRRY